MLFVCKKVFRKESLSGSPTTDTHFIREVIRSSGERGEVTSLSCPLPVE